MRRRNNANEDDGEDEEFQRVENDSQDQIEDGIERTDKPEVLDDDSEGEMVHARQEVDLQQVVALISGHDQAFNWDMQ